MTQRNERVLYGTKSICPVCFRRISARYVGRGEEVYFSKRCPEHGIFETLFWHGVEHFQEWSRPVPPQKPRHPAKRAVRGCPYDCGLCDNHKQATCCVLLEVTKRCNLKCPICFAAAGEESEDPSLETVSGWYDMLLSHGGPFNIQLSGGEPTMRDDLADIIRIGKEKGFRFFQLNTNGLRIAKEPDYLRTLSAAGLNTVFLQFDSLRGNNTARLRGRDILAEKKAAIKNCAGENLGVVLVPTLMRGCNDGEVGEILNFAAENMPTVRGVHFQPLSYFGRYDAAPDCRARITIPDILAAIETQMQGRLFAGDFLPGGAEHPLCSFHRDYEVEDGDWAPTGQKKPSCSCRACDESVNTSDAAREAVAEKWSAGRPPVETSFGKEFDISSLDAFLERKGTKTLAISAMAFQDVWTADLERLERCYINIVSGEGGLIPFCTYNLTSVDGKPLHRK